MAECQKEPQRNDLKKGMENLKTSPPRVWFRIVLTAVVTTFLILWYCNIQQMEIKDQIAFLWILGPVVALVLGHLWATSFLKVMRNRIYYRAVKNKEEIEPVFTFSLPVPATVLGVIERIFFGALVAFDISATGAAMVTWILVKMATDWNRILAQKGESGPRALAFTSLSASMISLFFALIGGLICRTAIMIVPSF
jgi:hypothetical protein